MDSELTTLISQIQSRSILSSGVRSAPPAAHSFIYCPMLGAQHPLLIARHSCSSTDGAAVAYVAELLSVPLISVKAVTDTVDGDKATAEEFLQNLVAVTAALDQAVTQVVDFLSGKCLSEL